ncbi:DEAD/DEAH box helicase [Lyngbya confervoides]|uniref:DEAD/DEAH box helicase n=1 Tax=Lyngbya confervoides BDU141951 TaxID=1574623 RepID=A0ABD4T171_9CYAN|nr:DEAD/DEAH box helicase [Lyngbya confervoides]MCM1982183.1 DEAD/DEAH box helicase [Lyngbya confervoides BDU141951]
MDGLSQLLDLSELYPFALDEFQQQAIAALNQGQSVVVSAPTGSGKTLIGEYAIHRARNQRKRVYYTTPLKALSNQKFRDFQTQFGPDQVGLLTGDVSIHREAPILVMTTEIFRNILYGTLLKDVSASLSDVAAVVLDECHYMNDRQRGTVWEESIIYCPAHIQLIALSATIANAHELTDWIEWVHGPTRLIQSDSRPVPLRFHFINGRGFFPLLHPQQPKLNPKLKIQSRRAQTRKQKRSEVPSLPAVVKHLSDRDLLPAIYFIFSRRRCEQAIDQLGSRSLVTETQAQEINRRIQQKWEAFPNFAKPEQISALQLGIASHHAGLLPLWKGFVEELFQLGLIKIVFATETLAAGINMPARTTIISSLSKRTDLGHRLLNASEFLQMSGRAGRRGMDEIGHVITLQTAFEGAPEAAYLATADPDPLVSQFTPSYGMVLNLLQTHTFSECQALIEKSFGQYLSLKTLEPQHQAIQTLEQDYQQLHQQTATFDFGEIHHYQKLQQRLQVEQKLLKTLHLQAEETRSQELQTQVDHLDPGAVVGISSRVQGRRSSIPETFLSLESAGIDPPLPACVVRQLPSSGQRPYWLCFGQDNHWYVLGGPHIVACTPHRLEALPSKLPAPPPKLVPKPGKSAQSTPETQALAAQIPDLDHWQPAAEVKTQFQRVQRLALDLQQHPAHAYHRQHQRLLRQERRLITLKRDLEDRQQKLHQQTSARWREFLALVTVLQSFDAMAGEAISPLGQIAAQFRGENELWLALVFASGLCDHLAPHHLAAVVAAVSSEYSRPDSSVPGGISPTVAQTLQALRPLKRQLIQAQYRQAISFPVYLEKDQLDLIENWALEAGWDEMTQSTPLDEGDIVRLIRRTLDILSQIIHISALPPSLRQNAKRAKYLMERFPISEPLGAETLTEED